MSASKSLDVLCIGHASFDLVFSIPHHPGEDEKLFADALLSCGGGPAANAAVLIARLGFDAGFSGYLGKDGYGDSHFAELQQENVNTDYLLRGDDPTPLSAILVKPDGKRALLNYKGATRALPGQAVNYADLNSRCMLCDGHEPALTEDFLHQHPDVPSVLDAGSLHEGTRALMNRVSYLVCSEKFAQQYAGEVGHALVALAERSPCVVITLGEQGLIRRRGAESGAMTAPPVIAIDSTGAGDAFHGAFAAAIANDMDWHSTLRYASAAGAFCCTRMGARPGLAKATQLQRVLLEWPE